MYTTSEQIELESLGSLGFKANLQNFKTCATGTLSLNFFRSCAHIFLHRTTFFCILLVATFALALF